MVSGGDGPSAAPTLEADIQRAESMLYDVAVALKRLRLDESTRGVHLRALDLKRAVGRWRSEEPTPEDRSSVLEEIRQLADETAFWLRAAGAAVEPEPRREPGPISDRGSRHEDGTT